MTVKPCGNVCGVEMPAWLHVVSAAPTRIIYADTVFTVGFDRSCVTVDDSAGGRATISLKSQQVAYKATVLGSRVQDEQRQGELDYASHFHIMWDDEDDIPQVHFRKNPYKIERHYQRGERIELGVEQAARYCVKYQDGVVGRFDRRDGKGFDFRFSTGLSGAFWQDADGSYTLRFQGNLIEAGKDDLSVQSKFMVTRSRYTGMLQLILQEPAVACIA